METRRGIALLITRGFYNICSISCLLSYPFVFAYFAEPPVAPGVLREGGVEIVAAEVGPVGRCEIKFAVRSLPQQEVAQPLFPAGTYDEVGVGYPAGMEFSGDRFGRYRFGRQLSGGRFRCERTRSLRDFGAGTVIDAEQHRQVRARSRFPFDEVDVLHHGGRHARAVADDHD